MIDAHSATAGLVGWEHWGQWLGSAMDLRTQLTIEECLAAISLFATLLIGILLVRQITDQRVESRSDDENRLFRTLCRKHRLNRGNRRLLKRLAATWNLRQPALLFVEPERLELGRLPARYRHERGALERLQERLFGDAAEYPTKPKSGPHGNAGGQTVPPGLKLVGFQRWLGQASRGDQ